MNFDCELMDDDDTSDDLFLAIDLDKVIQEHARRTSVDKEETTSENLQTKDKKKRMCTSRTPLFRLRFGRIWVSHVVAQHWCEQQMVYDLDPPLEVLQNEVIIVEPPEIQVGATLHRVRELEVEDVINVRTTSKEDKFAVKVINLMSVVFDLLTTGSTLRREIPVFGAPFGLDVFVIGVIDEIRCHQTESLQIELVEFKTRCVNELPGKAQSRSHNLQVMLYKRLFDELVMGLVSKQCVAKHMKLNLNKLLGREVLALTADKSVATLGHLLDRLFEMVKAAPFIFKLVIEYAFQPDSSTIGVVDVPYQEEWLQNKLHHYSLYWKGERNATGVDIEDLWKCNRCGYSELCSWRTNLMKQITEQTDADSQQASTSDNIQFINDQIKTE